MHIRSKLLYWLAANTLTFRIKTGRVYPLLMSQYVVIVQLSEVRQLRRSVTIYWLVFENIVHDGALLVESREDHPTDVPSVGSPDYSRDRTSSYARALF